MTRREFVCVGAGLAMTPHLVRAAVAKPIAGTALPFIDTHIHLYDPARTGGIPWPPKTDPLLYRPCLPSDFRAATAGLGLIGTVVVEASDWVEDNQWLLDLADHNPEIVAVVGNLAPAQPAFAAHLRRFIANPQFRGVRLKGRDLARLDDAAFQADVGRIADAGLSVDILGGSAQLGPTLTLARRFPSLRLVVNHLPFKEWDGQPDALLRALRDLAAQQNVFVKISDILRRLNGQVVADTSFYAPALAALCDLFGPSRILYASNWPVSDRNAPYGLQHRILAEFFAAQRTGLAEGYFSGNSRKAYQWNPREAAVSKP